MVSSRLWQSLASGSTGDEALHAATRSRLIACVRGIEITN
jgi:hypothetical protein